MIRTKKPKKKKGAKVKDKNAKLTPKELKFVTLYLQSKVKEIKLYNYECYRQVFGQKLSKACARAASGKLLNRPHVKRYIKEVRDNVKKKTEIDLEYFTTRYKRLIDFDQRKFYTKDKKLLHVTELDDDTAMGLHGLEFSTYTIKKKVKGKTRSKTKIYLKNIKLESRKGALDSLRDLLGFNKETIGSSEDFVTGVREFADEIANAVPGGKL